MNWILTASLCAISFLVGMGVGFWRNREWVSRFRYEAEHWNSVVDDWRKAYVLSNDNTKVLRQEVVALHKRITALVIKECEVLDWVNRSVEKVRQANEKSPTSSTPTSPTSDSTISQHKEFSQRPEPPAST